LMFLRCLILFVFTRSLLFLLRSGYRNWFRIGWRGCMTAISARLTHHLLRIQIGFRVVVKIESSWWLILLSGLYFASIAFFSEWEVKVIAIEAYPITFTCLGCCFGRLGATCELLDRCKVSLHQFKIQI